MQCASDHIPLQVHDIEEVLSADVFARFDCSQCGWSIGVEGALNEIEPLVPRMIWTDEALCQLDRLPFYLAPLVRQEVEEFAQEHCQKIVTFARMGTARNKGMVGWSPDAERRLENVPPGIRAMAKTELERTALDRRMSVVTVALMEEVRSRYFGMAAGKP